MSSQIKTKARFHGILGVNPNSHINFKVPQDISVSILKYLLLGMMIYNCLLQQISHCEFGFEFEFRPL